MNIKLSHVAAAVAVVGFVGWALTARIDTALAEAPEASGNSKPEVTLPQVEVQLSEASLYDRETVLQGQIEPWRRVQLRAQVSGTVESLLVQQGARVSQGEPLIRLSGSEYQAQLHSAKASVRLKEAELKGARKLYKTNLQTETAVLSLESELESARSGLVLAQQQLDHVVPKAPFDGVVDQLDAELGQYMTPGEEWGLLVNIDRLKVTAQVPQQDVIHVAVGQRVEVALLDGRQLEGSVSFVASAADPSTRGFPIEVALENPDQLRIAGASATLNIHLGSVPAHKLSPALLSLNEKGELGVKWVDAQNKVVFAPVSLLSTGTDGAWITGLPDKVSVISLGGGFVHHGQTVSVVNISGTDTPVTDYSRDDSELVIARGAN
ncbi:efflux RND transporter periplasmic adaptor subunit [Oceanospirillum linum]|uniref:efflux RND transporter periplasmic adaptor subunit n=1 Tax=Oceanospirillum linum TaxID=966 RepID=UPI00089F2B0D|nr:efflux RND transporter periplasmic adaptor subunit [Oceanospirillum linum]SEF93911.1 membrane fusion protein, multidrug efflux system [Oleiphilus messinensis]SMP12056.1 membrane fusion protein, multidrug efflux system [Oceanospirillum linum]